MRMEYGLYLEQTQKLIMTPELRQAIVILQLPSLELAQYIQQQLTENPVLEIKEETPEREAGREEDAAAEQVVPESETFDLDWQEYFQDGSDLGYIRSPREQLPESSFESFLTEAPTLHEHLQVQLMLALPEGRARHIGEFIIGNIDENGYLRITVEEIARLFDTGQEEVIRVLQVIQGFDPPGVGARNLVECLLLQLQHFNGATAGSHVQTIIQEHLAELGGGRLAKIGKALGISVEEVQAAADIIRRLDPKPGRRFGHAGDVRYIVPDVVVERVGKEYVVLVNDVSVPRLGINPLYQSLIRREGTCDEDTRRFIEGKLNAAAWIIRSIEHRRLTLYRVVNCIIDFQREFMEKGVKYLKPLTLKQVAEVLGLHESTVSRATSNKYAQTPQGVFELKFFFASGVQNQDGSATSAKSIKRLIQEQVQGEDPKNPLTDQELANRLSSRGIRISRRTVAKYRDEIGIPAVSRRKRY